MECTVESCGARVALRRGGHDCTPTGHRNQHDHLLWSTNFCASRERVAQQRQDRKSTRLNSSHANISYAVFCLKKKKKKIRNLKKTNIITIKYTDKRKIHNYLLIK